MHSAHRVAAAVVLSGLFAFATPCAAAPDEISLGLHASPSIAPATAIDSYPAAVDAIVRVMVSDFQLPVPRGKLIIYSTRAEFEVGLIEHLKIKPDLAKSTARFAKSAVGSYNVLVNEEAIAATPWPQRIELLAHELTHSVQLTLAKRPGLPRHQWLLEGTAEWLAFNVTAALKLDDMNNVRVRLSDKVRELRRKGQLPSLTKLDSFSDWVSARNSYGFDGTYSLSFLATDFLVSQYSFARVVDYFKRFEHSSDHLANFKSAFQDTPEDFDLKLRAYLEQFLK